MVPFTDHARHFYAMVALGLAATSQTRDDTLRVLDSLRFSSTYYEAQAAQVGVERADPVLREALIVRSFRTASPGTGRPRSR